MTLREKCPNTEFFLVHRIHTEYGDLRAKSPYSVQMQENTDQKKLRTWTLFTQCEFELVWARDFTLIDRGSQQL